MSSSAKQLLIPPALLALMLLFALPAQAAFKSPLNLSPFDPDLQVSPFDDGLSLNYTHAAGSSVLSITGTNRVGTYSDVDNSGLTGGPGFVDFSLTVNLLNDGSNLDTTKTNVLEITTTSFTVGTAAPFSGVILSGTVFDFGINTTQSTNSGTFEFLVTDLDSDDAGLFNWNLNSFGQVIASFGSGGLTGGNYSGTADFTGTGGVADNSVSVPLPGSVALLGLGVLGLRLARRGRGQD